MKSLIVYFSHIGENYFEGEIKEIHIGNTAIVSKKISELIGADLFELKTVNDYPYHYQECTKIAKKELQEKNYPVLKEDISIEDYETIYLGYPSWWSTMPMAVWTFLRNHDFTNKVIYPFCTHEGSGMGNSIRDLKTLVNNAKIMKGLAIQGSYVSTCEDKLKEWVK